MKLSTNTQLYIGLMLFSVLGGGFSIAGAIFAPDWFMNDHRASFFVGLVGRGGTRIIYVCLGLVLIGFGVRALTRLFAEKTQD